MSLLERSRAGTDLTTEGLRFAPHARGLRLAWTAAGQAVRRTGGQAVTMRIRIQHDLLGERGRRLGRGAARRAAGYGALCRGRFNRRRCAPNVPDGALDIAIHYTPSRTPTCISKAWARSPMSWSRPRPPTSPSAAKGQLHSCPNYAPAYSATHRRSACRCCRSARVLERAERGDPGLAHRSGRQAPMSLRETGPATSSVRGWRGGWRGPP